MSCHPTQVQDIMRLWTIRLSALYRLGHHDVMELELKKLGDLSASQLLYDNYPHFWPPESGKQGSMVPFDIRILACLPPSLKGNHSESIKRLYQFLFETRKAGLRAKSLSTSRTESSRNSLADHWRTRENMIKVQIANQLLRIPDYELAIKVLESLGLCDLDEESEVDAVCGRLHLQLGNLSAAEAYFEKIAQRAADQPLERQSYLLFMNKGLLAIAKGDWEAASTHLSRLNSLYPGLVVQSNLSLVSLYKGYANEALKNLELVVQQDPVAVARSTETLFNLSTLYDLLDQSLERKKKLLSTVIAKHAGDDFKPECLKL